MKSDRVKTSTLLMVLGIVVGITALLALFSNDTIGYMLVPVALILILTPAIGRIVSQGD